MAGQSKDESSESEPESDPEDTDRKADSDAEPHENPAQGSETKESEEQDKVTANEGEETEASVYTEQDLTEEGAETLKPLINIFIYLINSFIIFWKIVTLDPLINGLLDFVHTTTILPESLGTLWYFPIQNCIKGIKHLAVHPSPPLPSPPPPKQC